MPSERKLDVAAIKNLVIAGWTGRNVAALEAHIKELEAIGVKPVYKEVPEGHNAEMFRGRIDEAIAALTQP